jgi:putative component of membrane protein insertase Oxa1/YidC/SpoIIIJ protein YidD
MSALRRRLKRPETYLAVFALFVLAAAGDTFRPADRQVSARVYVGLVEFYQADISPQLRSYIACRYEPTCSEYSKQAVERFGILEGLALSWRRLNSCQRTVPMGTADPVPELQEGD